MGFRNIMISSNMKLRIQDQQLVVTAGDEVHIPLEDINCILIENQSVTLSAYLLQKVADSGIALYVCDEKHLPNAVLLPMVRHSRHFKILKYQMETGKPLWEKAKEVRQKRKAFVAAGCDPEDTKSGTVPAITGAGWT